MNKKFSKILLIELFVISYLLLVISYSVFAVEFRPQVDIPGFTQRYTQEEAKQLGRPELEGQMKPIIVEGDTFGKFMAALYKWATGAIAIICIVMIVYAGFRWMMAAGSASQIGKAKETMTNALIGLILVIGAYWLLNLLNPSLVKFKSLELVPPKPRFSDPLKRLGQDCTQNKDCQEYPTTYDLICYVGCLGGQKPAEINEKYRKCIFKIDYVRYCCKAQSGGDTTYEENCLKSTACVNYGKQCKSTFSIMWYVPTITLQEFKCCDPRLTCRIRSATGNGWCEE